MVKRQQNNEALTPKQELFCQEYITTFHITNSAIKAGYSEKTAYAQGSRLLKNVKIKRRIKELGEENEELMRMTRYQVLKEIKDIAEMTSRKVEIKELDSETGEYKGTGIYKPLDAFSALNAWEKLGKHFGMLDAKTKHQINKTEAETELLKIKAEQLKEYGPDTTTINIIDAWSGDDDEEE